MNFLTSFLQPLAAAWRGPTPPVQRARALSVSEPQAEERRWGCGWFDSSHELSSGLRVQELATPEQLAQTLPLSSWLELELTPGAQ